MRRDKNVARILFILSVVHVAAAAPVIISRRFLDEVEGLTPTLEKRITDDEWSLDSYPLRHPGSAVSMNLDPGSDSEASVNSPEPLSGSSRHSEEPTDLQPNPNVLSPDGPGELQYLPKSGSGASSVNYDASGSASSSVYNGPAPVSAVPSTHDISAPGSSTPPTHDDLLPESGTSPFHDDSLPVSATSPTHDGFPPESATLPPHDDSPSDSGTSLTHYESASESSTPQTHDDLLPESGTSPIHDDPLPESVTLPTHHDPELGTPEFHDDSHWWTWTPNTETMPADLPAHEGSAQSPHDDSRPELGASPTHDNSLPVSATSPTHGGSPPVSAALPTYDDSPPESVTSTTHHDPGLGTPEFHDDSHWWTLTPNTETVPADLPAHEGSAQSPHDDPLGAPQTHDDSLPVSATSPTHGGSPPVSAALPTYDDSPLESVTSSPHHDPQLTPEHHDDSHWWTLTPATEIVPADSPAYEGSGQTPHDDPWSKLGAPPLHDASTSKTFVPWWNLGHGANSAAGSSAHGNPSPFPGAPLSHAESVSSAPTNEAVEKGEMEASTDAHKFFTEELKQKMKDYAVLGTIAGVSTGILNGMQKEIMGTVTPGASTIGRDLASDAVDRDEGMLLPGLPGHFQLRKRRVSWGLANLRDEDLRLLSVLTRRALEGLD